VGHPEVLTRERLIPESPPLPWSRPSHNPYRGLLLVRVLPPQDLALPLLPYRTRDGRLTFPLCASCAEDRRQRHLCEHRSWLARSWVAAFTHVELNRGLQLGYRVCELFEVWNYSRWAGPSSDSTDPPLFGEYIDLFLKLKEEASGWPMSADTPEKRHAHLDAYHEREGIVLDPEALDKGKNPAMRQIAVLILLFPDFFYVANIRFLYYIAII